MTSDLTRRDLLKGFAGTTALLTTGALTGGCESLLRKIRNRPVRRDISTLGTSHPIVETYRDAVSAMRMLGSGDGRSWARQAQIHFDHCPHGNWFYFEEICRELTGHEDFALPYWNWQKNPSIPAHFWGGSGNPLFHSPRTATQTSTAPDWAVGAPVIEGILDEPNFIVFGSGPSSSGELESTPHNTIHGFVGGTMGSYHSPLDPVFWCHHNMVECLWLEWNRRGHANPNDPAWTQHAFNGQFFDRNGASVDTSVLATLLLPIFAYRFDDASKGEGDRFRLDREALRRLLEEGAEVRIDVRERFSMAQGLEVAVARPATPRMEIEPGALRAMVEEAAPDERLFLMVRDVTPPEDEDFFVRVFVGEVADPPDDPLGDPRYAGSFAFFADSEAPHREHAPSFRVDLTDAVRRVAERGELGGEAMGVTLVAVPFEGRTPSTRSFRVGTLEAVRSVITPSEPVARGGRY
jgi:tyrosinase